MGEVAYVLLLLLLAPACFCFCFCLLLPVCLCACVCVCVCVGRALLLLFVVFPVMMVSPSLILFLTFEAYWLRIAADGEVWRFNFAPQLPEFSFFLKERCPCGFLCVDTPVSQGTSHDVCASRRFSIFTRLCIAGNFGIRSLNQETLIRGVAIRDFCTSGPFCTAGGTGVLLGSCANEDGRATQ